ncbi:hypothetical protein HKX48_005778 [Thoreauomyces humboldtii]|nr:hypothetical protein HKX48_005778 [Thoreauomyces humboldtii]
MAVQGEQAPSFVPKPRGGGGGGPSTTIPAPTPTKTPSVLEPSRTAAPPDAGDRGKPSSSAIGHLRTISVVEFAEARAFELSVMEKGLASATEFAGVARAFQTVPRHMRRRAASHNPKRLPARLREWAKEQMEADSKATSTGTLRKAAKRTVRKKSTVTPNRSRGFHRWLETHVWHAKRTKITDIWGWKLPEKPNDRSFRSNLRAGEHQAVCTDISYFEAVELMGSAADIHKILQAITDPTLPAVASARFLKGTRQGSTFLYGCMQFPADSIGPATFLWRPAPADPLAKRTLWIWLHPAIYQLVHELLIKTREDLILVDVVSVQCLKDELVRFELTGPRCNAILRHSLKLCDREDGLSKPNPAAHSEPRTQMWTEHIAKSTPDTLPPGVVIGLTIWDPRTQFPPKMPPRSTDDITSGLGPELLTAWPDGLAQCGIWDPSVRDAAFRTRPSEGALNKRRSEALVPGSILQPTDEDTAIPILLIQRNSAGSHAPRQNTGGKVNNFFQFTSGWDLLAPKGWGMAFLRNFVMAGTRTAGLRDRHMFYFEAGLPCFPHDFPESTAHTALAAREGKLAREAWGRKPPGKRPQFSKLHEPHPFISPFDVLAKPTPINSPEDPMETDQGNTAVSPEEVAMDVDVPAVDKPSDEVTAMELDTVANSQEPPAVDALPTSLEVVAKKVIAADCTAQDLALPQSFASDVLVLRSPRIVTFLREALRVTPVASFPDAVLAQILKLSTERFSSALLHNLTASRLQTALVRVSIGMLRKGRPGDRASVFRATQTEYEFWMAAAAKKHEDRIVDEDTNLIDTIPGPERLLGYVTTGGNSAAAGAGRAIASCALFDLHRAVQEGIRLLLSSASSKANHNFHFFGQRTFNLSMSVSSDEEDLDCPLCMEEIDITDRYFKPCPCGYQICRFCWNHIKENLNGLCPACRRPYSEHTVEFKAVPPEEIARIKALKKRKERERKEQDQVSRRNLANARVVQKNLVYVLGLPPRFATEEVLRAPEYFGQYGKILRVAVNRRAHGHTPVLAQVPNTGVYITFAKKEDAARSIEAVDGSVYDGKIIRATYGTTKYCSYFLKNQTCQNPACQFLHEPGGEPDSFARDELSRMQARERNPKPPPFPLATDVKKEDKDQSALPATASWAKPVARPSGAHQYTSNSPLLSSTTPGTRSPVSDVDADHTMPIVGRIKPAMTAAARAASVIKESVAEIPPGLASSQAVSEGPLSPEEEEIMGSSALDEHHEQPDLAAPPTPKGMSPKTSVAGDEEIGQTTPQEELDDGFSLTAMGFVMHPKYIGPFDPFRVDPLAIFSGLAVISEENARYAVSIMANPPLADPENTVRSSSRASDNGQRSRFERFFGGPPATEGPPFEGGAGAEKKEDVKSVQVGNNR